MCALVTFTMRGKKYAEMSAEMFSHDTVRSLTPLDFSAIKFCSQEQGHFVTETLAKKVCPQGANYLVQKYNKHISSKLRGQINLPAQAAN